MTERGYIAIARGILNHPIVGARKPFRPYEAWNWLLFEAAFRQRRVRVTNGRTESYLTIQRGQLSYSRKYLAQAWGWKEKRVRTFIGCLEKDAMIARQKGQPQMVLTICNYEHYQNPAEEKGQQTGQQKGQQRASKGPETEEGKKERKVIALDLDAAFVAWYAIYPRKKAPQDAKRAFLKLMASGAITAPELMAKTAAFAAYWKTQPETERRFIPYPASWLNSGEYADEIPQAVAATSNGSAIKLDAPTRKPETFTEGEWLSRLAMHQQGNAWPEQYWGPAPGKLGCLVPPDLLKSGAVNV